MAITYSIIKNNLKEGSYYARVKQGQSVKLEQMIPDIVAKTSLSASDVQGVILALSDEIAKVLASGNTAVVDQVATFTLSISGRFEEPHAVVNSTNARLKFNARVAKRIQKRVKGDALYSREIARPKLPVISSFVDVTTETFNQYTPGSIIQLYGENLRFDKTAPDQGVFLNDGNQEIRLSVYSRIGQTRIDALVPAGTAGEQEVVVRARYTEGGDLRSNSYQQRVTAV